MKKNESSILNLAKKSKLASIPMASLKNSDKNQILQSMIDALKAYKEEIIKENQIDIKQSEENQLKTSLLKRLLFNENKIIEVSTGIKDLITMPNPVGQTELSRELAQGLELYRISCPIGVIGVIFESRPDVLVQIAALCLKSGNSVILKGGSEAARTNKILADVILESSTKAGAPNNWIQLIETRDDVATMLKCDQDINLIIPRGSNEFVRYILQNSNIPVLGHADGVCHVYIDSEADSDKAIKIVVDSKTQYVVACNAVETIILHSSKKELLPKLVKALSEYDVKIYGDQKICNLINIDPIGNEGWGKEYLDYAVSIKLVDGIDEAIDHINHFGSGHTDSIITENKEQASHFISLVDSANVFWNCSTRFSDGYRYGFGAEVGISTNKIHARGPVGMDGLLIYKYVMKGNGHLVAPFAEGNQKFTHQNLDKKFSI